MADEYRLAYVATSPYMTHEAILELLDRCDRSLIGGCLIEKIELRREDYHYMTVSASGCPEQSVIEEELEL